MERRGVWERTRPEALRLVFLGDGHFAAHAEGARGDFEAGGGLSAFVFVEGDAADDPFDGVAIKAVCDDFLRGALFFHEEVKDGVEDFVRGEGVLIALVGA